MSTVFSDGRQQPTQDSRQANQFTTEWTVDRLDTLKRLWNAGASQAEIAAELGVTRNSIAGKISRLKLTRAPSQRAPRKSQAGIKRPKKPNPALAWTTRSKPEPLPEEPAPTGEGVQLTELTNTTCRWPFGSVGAPDFCFCGVPPADFNGGRPYCRVHTNLARRT
ncbi:GcrA family cell cycle regulator [Bradyrhizobium liaoningense]|uniref:GcrA family cell cycle regulator n=1 Tax=Bradyrhizobium liaoningense TaxID=43992 RepID=UPI0004BB2E63|nr:GcrA family cell cycle regulator [Bradyrhizobium liaoningense]